MAKILKMTEGGGGGGDGGGVCLSPLYDSHRLVPLTNTLGIIYSHKHNTAGYIIAAGTWTQFF